MFRHGNHPVHTLIHGIPCFVSSPPYDDYAKGGEPASGGYQQNPLQSAKAALLSLITICLP